MEWIDSIGDSAAVVAAALADGLLLFLGSFAAPFISTLLATVAGAVVGVVGTFVVARRQERREYRSTMRNAVAGFIVASSEYHRRLRLRNATWLGDMARRVTSNEPSPPALDRSDYLVAVEVASLVAEGGDAAVIDALVDAVKEMYGADEIRIETAVNDIAGALVDWQRGRRGDAEAITRLKAARRHLRDTSTR